MHEKAVTPSLAKVFISPEAKKYEIVMFIDMTDAETQKRKESETSWLNTLGWFFDTVTEHIAEDGGGEIVKYLGDGAMAVFDKDLAPRALQAAVNIQEDIKKANRSGNLSVNCSIGISAGHTVCFENPHQHIPDYTGAVIDKAAGLCAAANAGAIFAGTEFLAVSGLGDDGPETPKKGEGRKIRPGDLQKIKLSGFINAIDYHEILWDTQPYGIKSRYGTETSLKLEKLELESEKHALPEHKAMLYKKFKGIIERYFPDKGYGFIEVIGHLGGKESVFFHKSSLLGAVTPKPQEVVFFIAAPGEDEHLEAKHIAIFKSRLQGRVIDYRRDDAYGFIMVENAGDEKFDFFFHASSSEDAVGLHSTVEFTVSENKKGPAAVDICTIPRKEAEEEEYVEPLTVNSQDRGCVKSYNPDRGFGFISCKHHEVFFLYKDIFEDDKVLYEGDIVDFMVTPGRNKSYRAQRIFLVSRTDSTGVHTDLDDDVQTFIQLGEGQ